MKKIEKMSEGKSEPWTVDRKKCNNWKRQRIKIYVGLNVLKGIIKKKVVMKTNTFFTTIHSRDL